MIGFAKKRFSPIGVDLGRRSVKMLQFSGDHSRIIEAARWDLPRDVATAEPERRVAELSEAICQLCKGRDFRGREAVICLSGRQLFVQNIRVAKTSEPELSRIVMQEAAGRLPYDISEAEVRYLDAADVRQGDAAKREVILLACHRPALEEQIRVIQVAGLRPVAVDVEPAALLRAYSRQFRRDEDRRERVLFVNVGAVGSVVVVAQGGSALFIKYIEVGGQHLDEAVARHLGMDADAAARLRRHNGDRRADQQDPEVARSVVQATRSVLDRLAHEIALCVRYHSVTFRGQPLVRMVLGGGEASPALVDALGKRLDMPCHLGEPLRTYKSEFSLGRQPQWDVVAGLALREVE